MTRSDSVCDSKGLALRACALVAYAVAVALRAPELLSAPRFSAEEGAVYFQAALDLPPLEALVTTHMDYYSLWNNLGCVTAAHAVPLESAPLVTTLFGFVGHLFAPLLILFGNAEVWSTWRARIAGLVLVLLVPPSATTWLTTNMTQFHLSIVAVLILIEPTPITSTMRRWFFRALLVIASLTGPLSCFLLPAFIARAVARRDRESITHAGVVAAGTLVQACALIAPMFAETTGMHRTIVLDLGSFGVATLTRTVLHPILGAELTSDAALAISRTGTSGSVLFTAIGIGAAGLVAVVGARLAGASNDRRLLVLAFACLLVPSLVLSAGSTLVTDKRDLIYPTVHERYFYAPAFFVALLLLMFVVERLRDQSQRLQSHALVAAVALAAIAFHGAREYRPSMDRLVEAGDPDWRDEVARWRAEPEYAPRVWPQRMRVRVPRRFAESAARHRD